MAAVRRRRAARRHGTLELEPGATLILYSDGLVERRGEAIDVGLEQLRAAAERSRSLGVDELCEALVGELLEGRPIHDDVVVLAIRAVGTTAASYGRNGRTAPDAERRAATET